MKKVISVVVFLVLMFIGTYFAKISGGLGGELIGYTIGAFAFIISPLIWKGKLLLSGIRGMASPTQPNSKSSLSSDEQNALYARALDEVESGTQDKGIWAKSLVDANGDTGQAKAQYIAARVEHFIRSKQKETLQKKLVELTDQIPKAEQRLENADRALKKIWASRSQASTAHLGYEAQQELLCAESEFKKLTKSRDRLQKQISQFS